MPTSYSRPITPTPSFDRSPPTPQDNSMAIQALSEKSDRILHFLSMTMDKMKKEPYWEDVSLVTNSSALSSKKKKGKSKKKHKKKSLDHSQSNKSWSNHPVSTRIL